LRTVLLTFPYRGAFYRGRRQGHHAGGKSYFPTGRGLAMAASALFHRQSRHPVPHRTGAPAHVSPVARAAWPTTIRRVRMMPES